MKKALTYVGFVLAMILMLGLSAASATATPLYCDPPLDFACGAIGAYPTCDQPGADFTCIDLAATYFNNLPQCFGEIKQWYELYIWFGFSPWEVAVLFGCRG